MHFVARGAFIAEAEDFRAQEAHRAVVGSSQGGLMEGTALDIAWQGTAGATSRHARAKPSPRTRITPDPTPQAAERPETARGLVESRGMHRGVREFIQWVKEKGAEMGAKAKLASSEVEGKMVDLGVQLHGGAGYMDEYEISRMYRDARVSRIYAGSSEIMKLIIGREIFSDQYRSLLT